MMELNYCKKINEISQVLTDYSDKGLSLIGKITVIKTLAIPKLVYLFTVLPSPSNKIIQNLEK